MGGELGGRGKCLAEGAGRNGSAAPHCAKLGVVGGLARDTISRDQIIGSVQLHVLEPIGKAVTEKVGTRDFAGAIL